VISTGGVVGLRPMTPISTIQPYFCRAVHFTLLLCCEALPVQSMPRSTPVVVVVVVVVVVTCIHSNWHIAWCEAIERVCGHAGHVVERGLCHTRPEPHAMKSRFGERKRRQVQPDMLASLASQAVHTLWRNPLCVITEIREQNSITSACSDDDQHDMCSIYA